MAKRGNCKICLRENVPMTKGHIIPDWIYRIGNLKENFYLPMNLLEGPIEDKDMPKPTGSITSYLFCKDCDEWLGEGESELRQMFLSPNSPTDPITSSVRMVRFPHYEIDSPKVNEIERAVAGIIFKMQFVDAPLFRDYQIPAEEMEQYRKALCENSPESDKFDFLNIEVIKLFDVGGTGSAPMSYFTLMPYEDGNGVSLFIAGLCILVTFDSHPAFKLRHSDKVKVTVADMGHLGYKRFPRNPLKEFPNFQIFDGFQSKWINIAFFRTTLKKYNDDDPCPCGLHWTSSKKRLHTRLFENCCKRMWFSDL